MTMPFITQSGFLVVLLLLFHVNYISSSKLEPSRSTSPTPHDRAVALASKMTLTDQLRLIHGISGPYVGNTPSLSIPIPNNIQFGNSVITIPPLHLEDGPQGVADGQKKITCFPNALAAVSSWDLTGVMVPYASALGTEQRLKGTNIMLGPMVNLARVPFGGRNFESMGEDPFLASEMVRKSVMSIQERGVIATVKHFVFNNQEENRGKVSAKVDERTAHELYLRPFQAAVNAGVGAVMCSYNKPNGTYACENDRTLKEYLKTQMAYEGFVMSDWGATHAAKKSIVAGLDMEMPRDEWYGWILEEEIRIGDVSKTLIQEMVVRILTAMYGVGIMNTPQTGNLSVDATSKFHADIARNVAELSAVLLTNDGILPLKPTPARIAVIGDVGSKAPIVTGGGSGHVNCPYVVTALEGIKNRAGASCQVSYAPTEPIDSAAKVAAAADVAIVVVGVSSSEGHDRKTLALGNDQDELIEAVAAAQPNTVVIVNCPGAVLMPWVKKARAIVAAWLPGQEGGNAIASVLFGDVNPSGRLPLTFPVSDTQSPLKTKEQYPGVFYRTEYTEKLLMGYRWYDAKSETPLFPFGHGLSYTMFQYSNLTISGNLGRWTGPVSISFTVTNAGPVKGREVMQLYLGYPSSAGEPPRVLRGFGIVDLDPKESEFYEFQLSWGVDVAVWDTVKDDWSVVDGTFEVFVGSSSRDLRAHGHIVVSSS